MNGKEKFWGLIWELWVFTVFIVKDVTYLESKAEKVETVSKTNLAMKHKQIRSLFWQSSTDFIFKIFK